MTAQMLERGHVELGLAPVADAFAATVSSDVVSMANHNRARFIYVWGVGTTGTLTLTVEACDDVTPSNTTAIPFRYRKTTAGSAPGAWADVAATGILTTAGSNQMYELEVDAAAVAAGASGAGRGFVRSKSVESVDSPILGGILIEMLEPRHSGPTPVTATA